MAKRPNLTNLQKQIDDLKIQNKRTEQRLDEHDRKLENIDQREIVRLLQEKNTPNSTRYRYTYEEIANIIGCSATTVNNVAKNNNLSRRLHSVK